MVGILGANSVSGGYEIDNSLRFNDGDTAELTRTPSSEGELKKHTISMWFKRCTSGTNHALFSAGVEGGVVYSIRFISDALYLSQSSNFVKATNSLFRDPSAWYHIVIAADSTLSTQNDRIKMYVNGVLETSFSENTFGGGQNLDFEVNDDVLHAVGYDTINNSLPFDGYISEFHLIDGTQLAASDFGEFNDNGVWIPKAYEGTYGTNGVYLEFKQTGTGTDASGMGADTSGNDLHYAPVNLVATDVTTDTPTNNFCTMNPLDNFYQGSTFLEGNTKVTTTNSVISWNTGTFGLSSGKWYWEMKVIEVAVGDNTNYMNVGIASSMATANNVQFSFNANDYAYAARYGKVKSNNEAGTTHGAAWTTNDIIGFAVDLDNNRLAFSKNGQWADGSGNSDEANINAQITIAAAADTPTGFYFPAVGDNLSGDGMTVSMNFGNAPYAISSGNADANGYGNFEYAVPSGYYSLCTKNLGEFG